MLVNIIYKKKLTDFLIKERLLNNNIDGLITINRNFKTSGGSIEFEKEYQLPFVNIGLKENIEFFRPNLNYFVKENFYKLTKRYVLTEYNSILYNKEFFPTEISIYFGIYNNHIVYYLDINHQYFENASHSKNDLCLALERLKQIIKNMKINT